MDEYALAIDVGGTFTDIVLLNLTTGDFQLLKIPPLPTILPGALSTASLVFSKRTMWATPRYAAFSTEPP